MIKDLTPVASYLYQQYQGNDTTADVESFFTAYNGFSQTNLDRTNNLNLPIYWGLSGNLLDWVANSLYGYTRPVLPKGSYKQLGLYNENLLNTLEYNEEGLQAPQTFYETTDDIFKRCLTWNFYKGDGQQFDIQWLKRRVIRFLIGGANPKIDEHWQVSVTFPNPGEVLISLDQGISLGQDGSLFNTFEFDQRPMNTATKLVSLVPIDLAPILQAAINAEVLQLPVGFTYTVVY